MVKPWWDVECLLRSWFGAELALITWGGWGPKQLRGDMMLRVRDMVEGPSSYA